MRMRWKVLLAVGVPLAVMSGIGFLLLAEGDMEQARSTFAVGVIAASVSGGVFIYQIDRWSLAKQSLVHALVMLVTVLPALLLAGWFDLSTARGWWIAIGVYAAWGAGLWCIAYLVVAIIEKRKARRQQNAV